MSRPFAPRRAAAVAACLLALLAAGCGRDRLRTTLLANQRPIVALTHAPSATGSPAFYAYEIQWTGDDPDGVVDHYLYCLDPPTGALADTPWVATTSNHQRFVFRSDDPDSAGTPGRPGGFHVFVIKSVDDRRTCSEPAIAAFFSFTVAPTVKFLLPSRTTELIDPQIPPTSTFAWTGTDPDGPTRKPAYYRYRRFMKTDREFDWFTLQIRPDSLRARYAPEFAGWDSVAGDTCRVTVGPMTPGAEGVMAVVAIDQAGAYTPVFSYSGNLLRFMCAYPSLMGPRISMWNEYFSYTYPSGGYNTDPALFVAIETPGGRALQFNWSAVPAAGSAMLGYRWALDLASIDDPAPRTDENLDWRHWSVTTSTNTHAVVGPFPGTGPDSLEQHTLYIEAEDTNHLKSLAAVRFRVLRNSGARPLLFVDDTRYTPDRAAAGRPDSTAAPAGLWPSAAELDTFLFAVGGVRWRNYVPVTTQSRPGILKGYEFDTIGTRGLRSSAVSLSLLSRYRCVAWYADAAEDYSYPLTDVRSPMPLLRYVSGPAQMNPLIAYSGMGGALWLMGGGIAYNSLLPWNVKSNDKTTSTWYTPRLGMAFSSVAGELVAGRMLFHTAHLRSQIQLVDAGRFTRHPALVTRPGGPDYSGLPPSLLERTPQTDPLPPMRTLAGQYYLPSAPSEILTRPNTVAGLDTLYRSGTLDTCVAMTFYHGPESGPTVFTGFPLWHFQRAQAIALADFVLQRLLGFPRRPDPR